jgi:hypothetical protein
MGKSNSLIRSAIFENAKCGVLVESHDEFACLDVNRLAIETPVERLLFGIEPEAYLRDILSRIGEHPINALLPWNIAKPAALSTAA